ncbi:MAG: SAM-dependent methyltransferase [Defluviitaleaceae bacterium]|nr:SAM-dependent methyltransferase [Defluviitaleaceae bacterium]
MLPVNMLPENVYKIVLSQPNAAASGDGREYTRFEILRGGNGKTFQSSMYTKKKIFHNNINATDVKAFINALFGISFFQYNAWDGKYEYSAKVTKKGKVLSTRRAIKTTQDTSSRPHMDDFEEGTFNRRKNHIIREGTHIPVLTDMGVFTKENKVAAPMRDKFRQINRFLELLADETKNLTGETAINIIDFGCGKSYLTFLTYHYFTEIRGLKANICGLDMNPDIVSQCSKAAEKYGYTSLEFKEGDIGSQTKPPLESWGAHGTFNIVISLHACDTATDHAIFNAIKWNADLICAVPCCQHELKNQMNPKTLKLFNEYGIIKERIASLATDAIRAKLLECCGYKSQIIEFTGMEHTPKNLFIRARRQNTTQSQSRGTRKRTASMGEVNQILKEFGFQPTLYRLLQE